MMATSTARKPHQVYRLANGERVASVTTILGTIDKPALVPWANKLGFQRINSTEYLNHVADGGTLSHALIEAQLTGSAADTSGYDDDQVSMAQNALMSFGAWAEGRALETRETELSLISERHHFGGTLDWYGLVDGRLNVIDFKTSSAIHPEHLYQLSAYHHLLTENGYPVDAAMVLRVDRDEAGEWSERMLSVPALEPYFAVFLAALDLYNVIRLATKGGSQ